MRHRRHARAVVVAKLIGQGPGRLGQGRVQAVCQRVFGDGVLPLLLPMRANDGTPVSCIIGLLTQQVYDVSSGERVARAGFRAPRR